MGVGWVLDGSYIGPRLELGWTWVIPEWVDSSYRRHTGRYQKVVPLKVFFSRFWRHCRQKIVILQLRFANNNQSSNNINKWKRLK